MGTLVPAKKTKGRAREDDDEADGGDDGGGDEVTYADYKKRLQKKARVQTAVAPYDPDEWEDWMVKGTDYKEVLKHFPDAKKAKQGEAAGMGLLEFAEYLEKQEGIGNKTKLKEEFSEAAGKDAPARWSNVDSIVGVIANTLE